MPDRTISTFLWLLLLSLPMSQAARAEAQDSRRAISPRDVVEALASAGVMVTVPQLEFLAPVTASNPNPSLRVVSIASATSGAASVKLRCRDNHECLPFYVLVHGFQGTNVKEIRTPSLVAEKSSSVVKRSPKERVVRGGDSATLILETADMRINLPVICLENGVRGQKIHVASTDRKQFYQAEVIEAGLLKGSL
jgi:hypothetical protein